MVSIAALSRVLSPETEEGRRRWLIFQGVSFSVSSLPFGCREAALGDQLHLAVNRDPNDAARAIDPAVGVQRRLFFSQHPRPVRTRRDLQPRFRGCNGWTGNCSRLAALGITVELFEDPPGAGKHENERQDEADSSIDHIA